MPNVISQFTDYIHQFNIGECGQEGNLTQHSNQQSPDHLNVIKSSTETLFQQNGNTLLVERPLLVNGAEDQKSPADDLGSTVAPANDNEMPCISQDLMDVSRPMEGDHESVEDGEIFDNISLMSLDTISGTSPKYQSSIAYDTEMSYTEVLRESSGSLNSNQQGKNNCSLYIY